MRNLDKLIKAEKKKVNTHQMHKWVRFSGAEKAVHAKKIKNKLQTQTCWICREERQKLWLKCVDIKEKERQMPFLETTYRISIPGKTNPIKTLTDSSLQSLQAYLSVNHLSKPRTRNSIQNIKTRPRPPTRTSVACFPTWEGTGPPSPL